MNTALKMVVILFLLLIFNESLAQTYQGPASGSVPNGGTVSTGSFYKSTDIGVPKERGTRNVISRYKEPVTVDFGQNLNPISSFYVEDPNVNNKNLTEESPSILLKSFKGHSMGNSIPPDPHMAVGPAHVISTVNVSFNIWDKDGNLIKTIDPNSWFQSLVPNPDCFDPQILYDHFDNRWIMSWDSQNDALQRAHVMIAVSDDSIPLGTWYIWALPANQNGNTVVSNWADYPQVGFDKNAIYINSRQFTFTNPASLQYNKIRIIKKSDIYNNPGGALSWKDIWDITDAQITSNYKPDNIIPAINYDDENTQYFLFAPRFGANFICLYKILDPIGSPVLSRSFVFVENYSRSPNANQQGGSAVLIDANESGLKSQPIVRDGYLWGVHSIANPTATQYSAVRYYKINVSNASLVETGTLGAVNYWYIFPTLAVDKDQNIAITYSRSGTTEYCGAYYTTRLKNDPLGLSGSQILQTGKGNYVVTFGGTRNRWGDYTGIYLDPADENNIWMHTEYVEATNRWGTWIGKIRIVPFSGVVCYTPTQSIDFGNIEVGFSSDTVTAVIKNFGEQNLIISAISDSIGPFRMVTNFSYPKNLAFYDSMLLKFVFTPADTGVFTENLLVTSNDPIFAGFELIGKGYVINSANSNVMYASSGINNSLNLAIINSTTGVGSNVGPLLNSDVKSISINPKNKILYGLSTTSASSKLLRVNAERGDAYILYNLPVGEMASIAFDTLGILYASARNGNLYTIDLTNGQMDSIARIPIQISSMTFNHEDNQLWASIFLAIGSGKDRIYKINSRTGDTTKVGQTGFAVATNGLAFDHNGNLFGITGTTAADNNLISINKTTGVGTLVGASGLKHLTDIAYFAVKPTSVVDNQLNIPSEFVLKQNYPNPFNPSTTIEFSLPVSSKISIKIYNILGQTVKMLFDGFKGAGNYKLNWNSDDYSGRMVSSGIYFYELKATGIDGREFSQMRKMILIR